MYMNMNIDMDTMMYMISIMITNININMHICAYIPGAPRARQKLFWRYKYISGCGQNSAYGLSENLLEGAEIAKSILSWKILYVKS